MAHNMLFRCRCFKQIVPMRQSRNWTILFVQTVLCDSQDNKTRFCFYVLEKYHPKNKLHNWCLTMCSFVFRKSIHPKRYKANICIVLTLCCLDWLEIEVLLFIVFWHHLYNVVSFIIPCRSGKVVLLIVSLPSGFWVLF